MPILVHNLPRYTRHWPYGQAVVTLSGQDFFLGPYGTHASRREYNRVIPERPRAKPHQYGLSLNTSLMRRCGIYQEL